MSHPFAEAQWIWAPGDPNPTNYYLAARRSFTLDAAPDVATLHISADSRYVLFVNGERVGRGPNRGWPFAQQYDSYDVTKHLRRGENAIAVLVHNFGVSTFQYMPGRGGLICRLEADGATVLVSDAAWRVTRHTGWQRPTPRAAMQMGWAEHYDAREELPGWTEPEFDDSRWERVVEIGPVGVEPWTDMSAREIPFLAEEQVRPESIVGERTVRPPRQVLDVNFRPLLPPGGDREDLAALVATVIRASEACTARLLPYGRLGMRAASLNGQPLAPDRGRDAAEFADPHAPVEFELPAGESLLVIDSGTTREYAEVAFGLDAEAELELVCPLPGAETPVAISIFAPSAAEDSAALIEAALRCASVEELPAIEPRFVPASLEHVCREHNGLATQYAVTIEAPAPRVDGDIAGAMTIHPNPGGDTEIIIDFGRELSGLLEFGVEAPAGVALDFYGFEAFREGEPHWTGIDAGLRYVTREGRQGFSSPQRRGLRYVILTIRGATAPVRLHDLRLLFSSYPPPSRGRFRCSDELLNRIWEMCVYTLRCCMEDTFVDCPLYEQALWVGDARNEALMAFAAFGAYEFTKRCWRLAAGSLFRSPIPDSRVPCGDELIMPAWSELWVLACEEQYHFDGDLELQREIYPAVATTLRNFLAMYNEQGLLEIAAWNMIDWAPMDTPREGVVTHNNAWLVEALRRGARMAEQVGNAGDATQFLQAADELIAAINQRLWDDERSAFIDSIHADGTRSHVLSQQTQTVCYLCGAVIPEHMPTVERYVFDPPEEFVGIGSPFFMFFSFEALAKLGLHGLILEWTRERWGEMLAQGATTAWEKFGATRSYCHAWSAGPAYFLPRYQLGIAPAEPGFARATIAPAPLDLDWCEGAMPTPHGNIEVAWRRDEGSFIIEVTLPPGVCADLVLPCATDEFAPPEVLGIGANLPEQADGMWTVRLAEGATVRAEARRG